jgi:hypothetical protein
VRSQDHFTARIDALDARFVIVPVELAADGESVMARPTRRRSAALTAAARAASISLRGLRP